MTPNVYNLFYHKNYCTKVTLTCTDQNACYSMRTILHNKYRVQDWRQSCKHLIYFPLSTPVSLTMFTVYGMAQNMEYTVQLHISDTQYAQQTNSCRFPPAVAITRWLRSSKRMSSETRLSRSELTFEVDGHPVLFGIVPYLCRYVCLSNLPPEFKLWHVGTSTFS